MVYGYRNYCLLSKALRKKVAWSDPEPLAVDGLGVDVYKLLSHSNNSRHLVGASAYHCEEHGVCFGSESDGGPSDSEIEPNNRFRYPLIRERRSGGALPRHHRAIIRCMD